MLYRQVLDTIIFHCPDLTCDAEEPLLNGVNPVPDSYFTASGELDARFSPSKARLNAGYFWHPSEINWLVYPERMYLQVSDIYISRDWVFLLYI